MAHFVELHDNPVLSLIKEIGDQQAFVNPSMNKMKEKGTCPEYVGRR